MHEKDEYSLFNGDTDPMNSRVNIRFLGSGDAFGSGARMQACIYVSSKRASFLIDCGASAMISMSRWQIDPNRINCILISHLHGDHFGGIPFFTLHAQLVAKRTQPLVIAGPPGLKKRIEDAMEVLFPGSSQVERKYAIQFMELDEGKPAKIESLIITPFLAVHGSGAPPYAFRIECEEKVIAYSGDTQWTESLVPLADGADLLICETYYFDKEIKFHLNYNTLKARRKDLRCKRIIMTHMGGDMLSKLDRVDFEYAEDGKQVSL